MKLKYTIVGFFAGVLAATALTAGASTIYEKYTAIARPDYKLVVDGQQVTLNTPPKTIDGVTHLPIRDAATILGKDVSFESGTITLTEKAGEKVQTTSNFNINQVEYVENTKYDYPTKTLLRVNFDITVNTDEIKTFREVDFFRYVQDGDKEASIFIVPLATPILPNKTTTLEILVPVNDNKSVTSITLRNPITQDDTTFNLSDL